MRGAASLFLLLAALSTAPRRCSAGNGAVHSVAHRCCVGQHVFVYTKGRHPGTSFLDTDTGKLTGVMPEITEWLSNEMGFTYDLVSRDWGQADLAGSDGPTFTFKANPEKLPEDLKSKSGTTVPIDIAIGVGPGLSDWADEFDTLQQLLNNTFMTTTVAVQQFGGLVRKKQKSVGLWNVWQPFSIEVWLVLLACAVLTGLLLPFLLIRRSTGEKLVSWKKPRSYVDSSYHMLTELLGAGDLEWTDNKSARALRLGWLLVILVSVSAYTANLAAFFTTPSMVLLGPVNMNQLALAKGCVVKAKPREGRASHAPYAQSLTWMDFPESHLDGSKTLGYGELVAGCAKKMARGEATVTLGYTDQLRSFLLEGGGKQCRSFHLAEDIRYGYIPRNMLVRRGLGTTFGHMTEAALTTLHASPTYNSIIAKNWNEGKSCPVSESTDTTRIGLKSQGGVFVIFAALACLGVFFRVFEKIREAYCPKKNQDHEPDEDGAGDGIMTEREMLMVLLDRVGLLNKLASPRVGSPRGAGGAAAASPSGAGVMEPTPTPTGVMEPRPSSEPMIP